MSFTGKVIKAGVIGGLTIAGIFAANKHLTKKYTSVNKTYEYNGFSWNYPQGKINYLKRGQGKPLLLLHNISVYSSCYEYSKVLDRLSEDHTVYALDFLGCGHSDKPEMCYTAFTFVQIIYMFINEIIGEETDIIASGLSCAYAVMAKSNFSDKIGRLTLVDPVSISAMAVPPAAAGSLKKDVFNLPVTGSFFYNMITSETGSRAYARSLFSSSDRDVSRETSDILCESAHIGGNGGKYLYSSIKNRFVYVDIRKSLKGLKDVNIIYGSRETTKKKVVSNYRRYNKSINIYVVPGAGTVPHYKYPAEFLTIYNNMG